MTILHRHLLLLVMIRRDFWGYLGLVLPVALVLIGVAVYGFFKVSDPGDTAGGFESSVSEKTYRPNILPEENTYAGLWVSSGVASFAYQNIADMDRQAVAQYIEQQMIPSDHVRYLMTDKKISVLVNGNTSLSGYVRK